MAGSKRDKRRKYSAMLVLVFGSFLLMVVCSFAQEGPREPAPSGTEGVIIEEPADAIPTVKGFSLQDSFKHVVEENRRLNAEKKQLQREIDKLNNRVNLYVSRIERLNEKATALQEQIQDSLAAAQKEKESLRTTIEELNTESQHKDETILSLEWERDQNLYFKQWQQVKSELDVATLQLKNVSIERESLREREGKLHYNLGNHWFKQGMHAKAAEEYEAALQVLPNDKDIYYNLALLYDYYLHDSARATEYYKQYLLREPDAVDASTVKERMANNDLTTRVYKEYGKDMR